jgi:CheY-like chemotaxis protein
MVPMILVADPSPDSRAHLSRVLTAVGYQVIAVATGMEAAQVLMETNPRLIVLDLDLKWVTGWRLIDLLRKNDRLARTPVLVIADAEAADGAGPMARVPVLRRPLDAGALVVTVDRLCGSAVPTARAAIEESGGHGHG